MLEATAGRTNQKGEFPSYYLFYQTANRGYIFYFNISNMRCFSLQLLQLVPPD